ncbi:MAG: DUF368 domain-containing protein [Ruminococcaceae bacterium]|nr:DUF368 domain-containing protein [Oscillospiraceae bacterium]
MEELIDLKYKNFKEILISIFVGFSIGLSVIVPGISGSTVAIIMKVYDKMMYAFSNLFKKFKLCFMFLLPIGIGVVVGFGIGFVLVKLLLELIPFITICFFVGLMVGTYPILLKEIKGEKATLNRKALFIVGSIIPIAITLVSMVSTGTDRGLTNLGVGNYVLFVVIGILISLTQIIPGLSATVLLMMFGYYTAILNGIGSELLTDYKLLLVYVALVVGFVIGILLFSKVINMLLEKQRKPFFFAICGLSIGSMAAVFLGSECIEIYKSWDTKGMVIDLIIGVLALALGFTATFLLYLYDRKRELKEEK